MNRSISMAMISLFLFLFGSIFAAIGFFTMRSTQEFLKTAVTREGIVVSLLARRSTDSTVYYPVVQFEFEGETFEFTSNSGSKPASYDVGEHVSVFFQPEQPLDAKINSFFSLWGLSLIFGFLGSLIMIVGLTLTGFKLFRRKGKSI